MTTAIAASRTGRSLISDALFVRMVDRIAAERNVQLDLAERILDQALAFLGTCGRDHAAPLAPSALVDIGWHAFILHTHDYADFCQRIAARFLHHVPTEANESATARDTLVRTVTAIQRAGFAVDHELWRGDAGTCTGCHNGCHDDPPPSPKSGQ